MRNRVFLFAAIGLAVALLASYPALAQKRMSQSQMVKPPPGWVRIGILNDDGSVNRYAYVDARELDRAIQRSDRGGTQDEPRGGAAGRADMREEARMRETHTVTGTLMNLSQVELAGVEQRHQIARVKTPEGRTARVDLGPVTDIQGLQLKDGDRVTVYGHSGTVNDVEVLMADRIDSNGHSAMVSQPFDRDMREYTGEVLAVRVASYSGTKAPDQVFARVRLGTDSITAVNLGPADQLKDVDLNTIIGKEISFLAHPARIGDRVGLVADQVRVEGRTIPIQWTMASAMPPYVQTPSGQ